MRTALVLALALCSVVCLDSLYSSKPVIDIATGSGLLAGVALNADSSVAYIAAVDENRIWALDLVTLTKTIIAGTGALGSSGDNGQANAATLAAPYALALDTANNKLYFGETNGQYGRVRVIDLNTGVIQLVSGAGASTADGVTATSAQLGAVTSLYFDSASNKLYVGTSRGITKVRVIDFGTGLIQTVAGTGMHNYHFF
jgi:predicted RNA methylase